MYKVIVLEDEPAVRKELVLLTPWDALDLVCVGEADSGDEGLELIKTILPDIIITDIRMPGMDGLEFIKNCKEFCEAQSLIVPEFLVLSGYSEFEYARLALRLGVSEYLLKPVSDADLYKALERAKNACTAKQGLSSFSNTTVREYLEAEKENKTYGGYVARAIQLIQEHYIGGITIEEAAKKLQISSGHLSRIFKQETGKTFVDYLVYIRIKRAIELLQDPCVKIYEVADLVGYSDSRYFANVFRKIVGCTPTEFREGGIRT